MRTDAISGAILGCAVGDALGLPYEGLSKRRAARLFGSPDRHRFLFRRGMVSDDTEHTCMVAQALCVSPADHEKFGSEFARRLRWWLLGAPAGIGSATLRATLKSWVGFSPGRSGVFSAGNGPAMRSAILGAAIDELESLRRFVRVSTCVTHSDPKAYHGALAIAVAAWCNKRGAHGEFFDHWHAVSSTESCAEFDSLLQSAAQGVAKRESTESFADAIGCRGGVSGYVYRTVPVVVHSWLSYPHNYREAVTAVIRCGGDTDTMAAIVGSIVGAGIGPDGIPQEWLRGVWEWPRSVDWMRRLAQSAADAISKGTAVDPPIVSPVLALARNALFLSLVLAHAGRRLLPPY